MYLVLYGLCSRCMYLVHCYPPYHEQLKLVSRDLIMMDCDVISDHHTSHLSNIGLIFV